MKAERVKIMTTCVGRKKCVYRGRVNVHLVTWNAAVVVTQPVLTDLYVIPLRVIVYVNRKHVPSMLHGTVHHVRVCVKTVMKCAMVHVTQCVTVPG